MKALERVGRLSPVSRANLYCARWFWSDRCKPFTYASNKACATCLFLSSQGDKGVPGHPGPKGEPGQFLSAPDVNVSPVSLTVTENQTANFHCSASGHPKPKVSWRKINGAELVTPDGPDTALHVRTADYNDSGSYMCTATSVLGKAQKMVKLYVEG